MRGRDRPWWVIAAAYWLTIAVLSGGAHWLGDRSAPLDAVEYGALFGIPLALLHARQEVRAREARAAKVPELDAAERAAALRAAVRGPVPADPRVRAAAVRLAARAVQDADDRRPLGVLGGAVLVVGSLLVVGVHPGAWWLLLVVPPLCVLALVGSTRRPRRRLALLESGRGAADPPRHGTGREPAA